jgi:RNA polymerase sigma-70 factor (ECF subfamily)
MPEKKDTFQDLLQRARECCDESARELVERYGPHILRVVRRRLNKRLRSKFDSVDFVQAVWASFFALPMEKYQFDRPEQLVEFLMGLARNKVVDAVRQRLATQKYNIERELPIHDSAVNEQLDLAARGPTASQVAIAKEECERLQDVERTRDERILDSLGTGLNLQEIAREIGVSEKTVRRVLRRRATGFAS